MRLLEKTESLQASVSDGLFYELSYSSNGYGSATMREISYPGSSVFTTFASVITLYNMVSLNAHYLINKRPCHHLGLLMLMKIKGPLFCAIINFRYRPWPQSVWFMLIFSSHQMPNYPYRLPQLNKMNLKFLYWWSYDSYQWFSKPLPKLHVHFGSFRSGSKTMWPYNGAWTHRFWLNKRDHSSSFH